MKVSVTGLRNCPLRFYPLHAVTFTEAGIL